MFSIVNDTLDPAPETLYDPPVLRMRVHYIEHNQKAWGT